MISQQEVLSVFSYQTSSQAPKTGGGREWDLCICSPQAVPNLPVTKYILGAAGKRFWIKISHKPNFWANILTVVTPLKLNCTKLLNQLQHPSQSENVRNFIDWYVFSNFCTMQCLGIEFILPLCIQGCWQSPAVAREVQIRMKSQNGATEHEGKVTSPTSKSGIQGKKGACNESDQRSI